jgi:hypothetical protein
LQTTIAKPKISSSDVDKNIAKKIFLMHNYAFANSLKDSNANPKMKTTKEGVGARSLAHNTFKVRGACWSFRMGTRMSDKHVNYS